MRNSRSAIVVLWAGLAAVACSRPAAITDCAPKGNAQPVCTFQNPEDFALLPDGRTLVVSQMGSSSASGPGNLVLWDLPSKWVTAGWSAQFAQKAKVTRGWGDPACPGPPDASFSPHGVSFGRRPDGKDVLLVVNHGSRESVEFIEVIGKELLWRGCVVAPDNTSLNDVTVLPDGGFVATKMFPKRGQTLYSLAGIIGFSTGYALEWQPNAGFRKVPGSEGRLPNGVEASKDGESLYLDIYLGNEIRKVSRRTGETLASVEVAHPDNIMWSPDGSLLVASHNTSLSNVLACNDVKEGACPARFSILQVDPDTLATTVLYENEGPPMGAGTAALRLDNELIIGTFAGNRMLRVDLTAGSTTAARDAEPLAAGGSS